MFTDGVTEAMNSSFEEYGDERLNGVLENIDASSCQDMINVIKSDVANYTEGAEQSDDITLLILKRL
jgi:sigma-B regulation protein RsbU (phosphoserine phosphatase)